MSEIKVFGHKAPDTDTVASAIVWSWFITNHRDKQAQAYRLGQLNTETEFVLTKWSVDVPPLLESVSKDDVVTIVDTNNVDELFENINDTHFVSIIDHHKLTGGLETSSPREIVIQPYACTMTVMYNIMNIEPADFPREIAGLMLSGILSDTLEFRSPTTTDPDKELAEKLAATLDVDMTEYANEMFAAKSDISSFSDEELVKLDSKVYEIKGKKLRLSVLETTRPDMVFDRREGIMTAIDSVLETDEAEYVMFFVIDILKEEATFLSHNKTVHQLAVDAFGVSGDGDLVLPGVVSRKKQIIPELSK